MSRAIQFWATYGAHANVHYATCVDFEDCFIRSRCLGGDITRAKCLNK